MRVKIRTLIHMMEAEGVSHDGIELLRSSLPKYWRFGSYGPQNISPNVLRAIYQERLENTAKLEQHTEYEKIRSVMGKFNAMNALSNYARRAHAVGQWTDIVDKYDDQQRTVEYNMSLGMEDKIALDAKIDARFSDLTEGFIKNRPGKANELLIQEQPPDLVKSIICAGVFAGRTPDTVRIVRDAFTDSQLDPGLVGVSYLKSEFFKPDKENPHFSNL